jgi:hypothetical protein
MVHIRQHPITGEMLNTRDYDYTSRAYEMMTPKEKQMSEERDVDMFHNRTEKFLKDYKKFQDESKISASKDKRRWACQVA